MKVLLATGVSQLNEAIKHRVRRVDFVGEALYNEMVEDLAELRQPDVIILSELLEGIMPTRELVLKIVTRFTDTRIIYIMKENKPEDKRFLYKWHVFDILPSKFNGEQLDEALFNPKQFSDVKKEFKELEKLVGIEDEPIEDGTANLDGLGEIKGDDYKRLRSPHSGTPQITQQVVSFWSVRDQAGKTFSLVNTALMLATAKDVNILILDFNLENPGVHLQLKFFDQDRNLGALVQDLSSGQKITKNNFEQYLYEHPVYSNLKVLPGNILKMKNPDDEFNIKVFNYILKLAEQSGFNTILVDTNSGVRDPLTVEILKKSTRVLLHLAEEPGSLNAARRCFDPSIGPFAENMIDSGKVVPVVTKSKEVNRITFLKMIEKTLRQRAGAYIEDSELVLQSLSSGQPILSKKPTGEMYNSFVMISNLIHQNLFAKPIKSNANSKFKPAPLPEKEEPKKKSLFSGKKKVKKK